MGAGNLLSIQRGLERVGITVEIVSDPKNLKEPACIILPGVGNFGYVSQRLEVFREAVINKVNEGCPLFGICLGMQLLFEGSEEGPGKGIGFFKGNSKRFDDSMVVPHIGWNSVRFRKSSGYLESTPSETDFYFVHSYYIPKMGTRYEIALTEYNIEFVSIVQRKNVIGTQFHPERSGEAGRTLLNSFADFLRR